VCPLLGRSVALRVKSRMQNDEARMSKEIRSDSTLLTIIQHSGFIVLHSAFSF